MKVLKVRKRELPYAVYWVKTYLANIFEKIIKLFHKGIFNYIVIKVTVCGQGGRS